MSTTMPPVQKQSAAPTRSSLKSGMSKDNTKTKAKAKTASAAAAPTTKPKTVTMISGKVDAAQVLKACKALAAYTEKRLTAKTYELPLGGANSLGASKDADNTVWMQITVKKLDTQRKVKPARIPLAHPLLDEDASVCLLTKDPQREYKDLLMEKNITSVNRVVGVEKLKGKFRPFAARRELVREHDLFLADERIVPMLPKLCGSVFYKDRKFPIPVDLVNKKRLPEAIERAIASTYYMQNKGSCSSIKIGFLHRHTPQELVENFAQALPAVVAKIPGKWSNVQNIELKTGKSAALPVWNCRLGEGDDDDLRWAPVEATADDEEDDGDDHEEEEEVVPVPKRKAETATKKTKRVRAAK